MIPLARFSRLPLSFLPQQKGLTWFVLLICQVFLVICLFNLGFVAQAEEPSNKQSNQQDLQRQRQAEEHFTLKVLPILEARCFACHGGKPGEIQGQFDLTSRQGILRGGESESPAVLPGRSQESLLLEAIRWEGLQMPPKKNDRLSKTQIAAIEQWIATGAVWPDQATQQRIRQSAWSSPANQDGLLVTTSGGLSEQWPYRRYKPENLWAYQPLKKPRLPGGQATQLGAYRQAPHPIDRFIDRHLQAAGLSPAPRADPRTLIRRASFDLLGLPPSPEEIRSFLRAWKQDPQQAWLELVERLLASPQYGEQWARHWLDVVRYADSAGFANDYERPNAWRYRDYVIRSLNDDKPYDQFIREQLAGDEINAEDPEMLIAVGFLRMGPWEHTGMSVAKVTRQQFLDDVTDTVGQVFLAHPLQCARCHDHKFDPIPTRDYYRLQAIFATTQFADLDAPWLPEENRQGMQEDRRYHQLRHRANEQLLKKLTAKKRENERNWFAKRGLPYQSRQQAIQAKAPKEHIPSRNLLSTADDFGQERIARKWRSRFSSEFDRYKPIALSILNGRTQLPRAFSGRISRPKNPHQDLLETTAILAGGDVFSPTQEVTPGVLSAVPGGLEFPVPRTIGGRRRALANWIASGDNPLTARVMVNRLWQHHFGRGIAGNPNNFGATGKKPTHPQLLDWLAAEFVQSGWSIKQMHRLMMTSQLYQRSSTHPDGSALRQKDPLGELYAVFAPRRLSGEELRDAMLAVSGELNLEAGGIPIRPDMNLEAALQPRMIMGTFAPAYVPHPKPEQRNRRSIYALKIRGQRDPFFEIFNQPSPDRPCERRESSTVTPQVFTLFNGQETHDRARVFAARVLAETDSDDQAIRYAFALAYGRFPDQREHTACLAHWRQMEQWHAADHPKRQHFPTEVVRRANEENTGEVFSFTERLFVYDDYIPDLQPHQLDAKARGLAELCLVLLNSNEFIYVY